MRTRQILSRITERLYKGKVVVIFGARRVGKTTLTKQILSEEEKSGKKIAFFNGEDLRVSSQLETSDPSILKNVIGDVDIAAIDEAQHIKNIGLVLKILNDTYPNLQIIATGSSSFDLSNKTGEPPVGRAKYFKLYPLALKETADDYVTQYANIDQMLIFGGYPSVVGKCRDEMIEELNEIVSGYLYKDILALDSIKHSDKLVKLLQLLALQIGNEVSYNELGTNLGMDRATVEKYIDLLEKCFVIFRLRPLSRNLRKEISKSCKIYFLDLGMRNCLIQNFNNLDLRTDVGALWENFCIVERMKKNSFVGHYSNNYFWRTYKQQEIDYIEEYDGLLHAYEFKYSAKVKVKIPDPFLENYSAKFEIINQENFMEKFI